MVNARRNYRLWLHAVSKALGGPYCLFMDNREYGDFRHMQAIADLRHHARAFPLASVRRIGAGIGTRTDGGTLQQRLEWYFRGQLPLSSLRSDPRTFGAVLMASALPEEDFDCFVAATVLLVLERLTSRNGPDEAFWKWRRLAPHFRLAPPSIRAAIMCGFREAGLLGRIRLGEAPAPADCLTAPREDTLAALVANDHPVLGLVAVAVNDNHPPASAGTLWLAQHRAVDTLSDDHRRAAHRGFRHLYERPESIRLDAATRVPAIPVHD